MKEKALTLLREATLNPLAEFREGQWEAIDGVLRGTRQLVVQRTGWGKSMIYFLAAKFLREQGRGMTLLISPLLALMRNQVAAAERVGVKCFTINSTNPRDWTDIKNTILANDADLLIISPERLANDSFRAEILEQITDRIGLLVVDEAHCVSDWGHDFRPDYKKISRLLEHLPRTVPVLATTATATSRVIEDIKSQLGGDVQISRGNLVRKSLFLQNIALASQEARLAWLAQTLSQRIAGSGIIYTLTIRDAATVARWLRKNGIACYAYASKSLPPPDMDEGLRKELESLPEWNAADKDEARVVVYRRFLEDLLLGNRIRALVATSALSMGFDKPDLSFVIHYQRPQSVVHYYQQVGRAGRALDSAYGVLLNGAEDDRIAEYFIRNAFPPEDSVRQVLDLIASAEKGLSIVELQNKLNMRYSQIGQVLKFVMSDTPQPIVKDGTKYRATPFVLNYKIPTESINRLTGIRHEELRVMNEYVATQKCLMKFLCDALESPAQDSLCGNCASCSPDRALPQTVDENLLVSAEDFVNGEHFPILPKKRWADSASAATEFGIPVKATIPEELQCAVGVALSQYGTGKLGRLVREGKYKTTPARFDDRLVEATAKMIMESLLPKSEYCIVPMPSRRDLTLVADFSERLAACLNVACCRCLEKIKDTPPQKNMENSVFQQNNLIGVLAAKPCHCPSACLLIDDMVDSRWTMTIAGAKLRQAGFAQVIPVVLADSSNGGE